MVRPLPAWLSFDDTTGQLTGTPPQDFNGTLNLRLNASDGTFSTPVAFDLTILPVDDAPLVGEIIDDVQMTDGDFGGIRLPADAFVDVDGDPLTLTVTQANGDPLPSWLEYHVGTNILCGRPPEGFVGDIGILVTASDGTSSVEQTFTIVVGHRNDPPIAADDSGFSVFSGASITIDPASLLANDTDTDGPQALEIVHVQGADIGTVAINDVGEIIFTGWVQAIAVLQILNISSLTVIEFRAQVSKLMLSHLLS